MLILQTFDMWSTRMKNKYPETSILLIPSSTNSKEVKEELSNLKVLTLWCIWMNLSIKGEFYSVSNMTSCRVQEKKLSGGSVSHLLLNHSLRSAWTVCHRHALLTDCITKQKEKMIAVMLQSTHIEAHRMRKEFCRPRSIICISIRSILSDQSLETKP